MWMLLLSLVTPASAEPEAPLAAAEVPAHVVQRRDAVDWKAAGAEAVSLLQEYLRVDTTNPPGNEAKGVDFLGQKLAGVGVKYERYEVGPGRASLVARLPAAEPSKETLCLMSHIDVVSAEKERWKVDPLSGDVRDGYVWGRGALDMKGMGALELAVMLQLARQKVPLKMDVVLVAVADEEEANGGMKQLVAEHWADVRCTYLLNEGGIGLKDALFEGQALHAISFAEKGLLWVDLVAEGPAGHGSSEHEGEAPARLLEAMERVRRKYHPKAKVDPALYDMLHAAGEQKGGFTGFVLKNRLLVDLLVKSRLKNDLATRPAVTDTVHLTGLKGAKSTNVVPSEVRATYDCRLLRFTTPEAHLAELNELTEGLEGIRWEVDQREVANGTDWEGDPLYEAIARYAVEGRPNAVAGPVISVGFTDSLYARPLGVHAFGYVPFEITTDEAATMHGHDERVSVENVNEGLKRLYSIVLEVAAEP